MMGVVSACEARFGLAAGRAGVCGCVGRRGEAFFEERRYVGQ
jgi:hypothetical protein